MLNIIKKMIPNSVKVFIKVRRKKRNIRKMLGWCCYNPDKTMGFIMLPPHEEDNNTLGGMQYYSQMQQDMYLDNVLFHRKEDGFFCDVGGNDPIFINNTYFFERERKWKGIAFEPMPKMNEKWKQIRGGVECLQCALGKEEKTVEFCEYEDDYMSGLEREVNYQGAVKNKYKVEMRRLADVFCERNITYVDFMSIDVEGSELGVLEGIDFSAVTIHVIVIENDKGGGKENAIRKFLHKKGYVLQARLWIDDVWVKKDIAAF